MKVSIFGDERYPDYCLTGPDDNYWITLPDDKIEWIRRVTDEYNEVQAYLERASNAAYAARPVRYRVRLKNGEWISRNGRRTTDKVYIQWFDTEDEAQSATDQYGECGTVEPSHVRVPLPDEWA